MRTIFSCCKNRFQVERDKRFCAGEWKFCDDDETVKGYERAGDTSFIEQRTRTPYRTGRHISMGTKYTNTHQQYEQSKSRPHAEVQRDSIWQLFPGRVYAKWPLVGLFRSARPDDPTRILTASPLWASLRSLTAHSPTLREWNSCPPKIPVGRETSCHIFPFPYATAVLSFQIFNSTSSSIPAYFPLSSPASLSLSFLSRNCDFLLALAAGFFVTVLCDMLIFLLTVKAGNHLPIFIRVTSASRVLYESKLAHALLHDFATLLSHCVLAVIWTFLASVFVRDFV